VTWVCFADNEGGRWGKWEEQGDEEKQRVGKVKSCLRFEGVMASGLGNSGAVTLLRAKDPKVRRAQVCMSVVGLVCLGTAGSERWP